MVDLDEVCIALVDYLLNAGVDGTGAGCARVRGAPSLIRRLGGSGRLVGVGLGCGLVAVADAVGRPVAVRRLVDAARAYGDTTVVEGTNGYYVLLFVGRNHNDYALRSFRHILVQVETGDEVDSGAATLAAQSEANTLYEQWQENPTEDNFAEMANANSDDGGSNTKGGLYEDVQYGQMVKPIEDWLFDEARQPGDSTVVYASNSNYSGYHIVYYVGEEDHNYNLDLATTAQQNDDYAAWLEEKEPSYPIQKLFAFRFTK